MDTSINNEKTFDFEGSKLSETEFYEFKQKVQEKMNTILIKKDVDLRI